MKTTSEIAEVRQQISNWRKQGLTVAFVPTMGNLHAGHIALINAAQKNADRIVASIFVNPMQFGESEDIDNYPRTMANDQEKLKQAGTNLLFTPSPSTIYPKGLSQQSYIEVPSVSQGYCSQSRPGHFRGVATVVCKLFNIVQPDVACFGLKDYQQLQVIKTMVEDLSMPISIIPVETVREQNGLALSSRNSYLSDIDKEIAPALSINIRWLAEQIKTSSDYINLAKQAEEQMNKAGLKTDYIHICQAKTLQPAQKKDTELVILAAAHCGKARLIDNLLISLEK
ncbi:pantoate--beta-alanine ligase [Thalassotalea piscium]|uniref:Pantothenate synthetase n=1 Tax=Thalassotalea piscium TaxID=1230533 RepID=A0A7X0TUU6_9GAMM|nr:pantoate--beta-alanine ligase [Thalassotalea piscium]MBB6544651.1 pantoate--beta-alanine ligase [Thalassotalea piscium]